MTRYETKRVCKNRSGWRSVVFLMSLDKTTELLSSSGNLGTARIYSSTLLKKNDVSSGNIRVE